MLIKKRMDVREIYEHIFPIARQIARNKGGALFIVGAKRKLKRNHELMFPEMIGGYSLKEPGIGKVLVKLATLDGAVLISDHGDILAYGAKLKRSRPLKGFGTRHAAACGMTYHVKDSFGILVSEESNWVKIFKEGGIALEIPEEEFTRDIDQKIFSFLVDKDTALLTDSGISVAKFPKIRKV